jgi:hypothetical protein
MPTYNNNDVGRPVDFGDETTITEQPVDQQVTENQDQRKEGQRKDRAKQRIKQLASEKNAAKQEAADYKRLYEEAKQQMQNDTKASSASLRTTLETQYNAVLAQMGDAIRAGEADKVVQCQDAMLKINNQIEKLASPAITESPVTKQQPIREEQTPQTPELAKLWIEDHPVFHSDELFRNAALTINNQLLREGYDSETEEFYEALSVRLSKRFPEVFGTQGESVVSYKGDENDSDDSALIVKQERPRPQVRTQEQVVSGSARPSANTIRSSRSPNSQINFTQKEANLLDSWGLDKEKIAKRIQHNETNSIDGYVPIIIPRQK